MASTPTVTPGLLYHNAEAAIDWLGRAFGFLPRTVIRGANGCIVHAHLTFGAGGVMLSSAEGYAFPWVCQPPKTAGGIGTVEIIVVVRDAIEAHYERAVTAGAEIVIPLENKPYGGQGYTCRDIGGHVWAFGTYDPWGD